MLPQLASLVYIFEKVCLILGAILYLIFAVVVVKQTHMMSKNVQDKFNEILKVISYVHLLATIFTLLLTFAL